MYVRNISNKSGKGIKIKKNIYISGMGESTLSTGTGILSPMLGQGVVSDYFIIIVVINRRGKATVCQQTLA